MYGRGNETARISPAISAGADALAGVAGSLFSLVTFYPLDVYKVRTQAGMRPMREVREGASFLDLISRLFAGLPTKSLHTAASSFCYFYLYSAILSLQAARSKSKTELNTSTRLALTCVAAILNTFVTLPLDTLSARHQTRKRDKETLGHRIEEYRYTKASSAQNTEEDTDEEGSEEVREGRPTTVSDRNGVKGLKPLTETRAVSKFLSLWKGLVPSLLLCVNPAIHFTCFDSFKAMVLERRRGAGKPHLSMFESFVLGIVAKFVATGLTYPLIRAKVMLMVLEPPESTGSMWTCLRDAYRQKGVRGLYQGYRLQLAHTLLKSALLMMVRERIQWWTRNALAARTSIRLREGR